MTNSRRWPVLGLLLLTQCQSSPPAHLYLLTPPAAAAANMGGGGESAVMELRSVSLPDYLDTSDIVSRNERNEIHVSTTGRWAERLSIGIADALRSTLARLQPDTRFVKSSPSGRQLLIEVEDFDMEFDGTCVLIANWAIAGAPDQSGHARIVTRVPEFGTMPEDGAIVTAMTNATEQLGDRIAQSVVWPLRNARPQVRW